MGPRERWLWGPRLWRKWLDSGHVLMVGFDKATCPKRSFVTRVQSFCISVCRHWRGREVSGESESPRVRQNHVCTSAASVASSLVLDKLLMFQSLLNGGNDAHLTDW